jgi:hypothetical protein
MRGDSPRKLRPIHARLGGLIHPQREGNAVDAKMKMGLIAFGCVGGLVLIVAVVVGIATSRDTAERVIEGKPLLGKAANERSIGDLVEHFQKNGLNGKYFPCFALAGSEECGIYMDSDRFVETTETKSFQITIYRYSNEDKAKSLEKTGVAGNRAWLNGCLVVVIYKGEKKVLPVFNKF